MSKKNPDREIYFFKHDTRPLVYILMSLNIDKDAFYELFPGAQEISQAQLDELVELNNFEIVMVGDDHIIDEYFTDKLVNGVDLNDPKGFDDHTQLN